MVKGHISKRFATAALIIAVVGIVSAQQALAATAVPKPFALIVPEEATVGVGGGHNITDLGYFIATSQELTYADFANGSFNATETGSGFTAAIEPLNVNLVAPLAPGQVGGINRSVLNSLLLPGETLKNPAAGFYQLRLQYPAETTLTQTMTGQITIAGSTATFQTLLHYDPSQQSGFVITSAQRITVPEPGTGALLACASMSALATQRRRRKAKRKSKGARGERYLTFFDGPCP
jgi:hypothetical protein